MTTAVVGKLQRAIRELRESMCSGIRSLILTGNVPVSE